MPFVHILLSAHTDSILQRYTIFSECRRRACVAVGALVLGRVAVLGRARLRQRPPACHAPAPSPASAAPPPSLVPRPRRPRPRCPRAAPPAQQTGQFLTLQYISTQLTAKGLLVCRDSMLDRCPARFPALARPSSNWASCRAMKQALLLHRTVSPFLSLCSRVGCGCTCAAMRSTSARSRSASSSSPSPSRHLVRAQGLGIAVVVLFFVLTS